MRQQLQAARAAWARVRWAWRWPRYCWRVFWTLYRCHRTWQREDQARREGALLEQAVARASRTATVAIPRSLPVHRLPAAGDVATDETSRRS